MFAALKGTTLSVEVPKSRWLNRRAERQMQDARDEGKLCDLAGEGKPLPGRHGDAFTDPGGVVGIRTMVEAGVLPEKITPAKAISKAKTRFRAAPVKAAPKAVTAEISEIELWRAIASEARRAFLRP